VAIKTLPATEVKNRFGRVLREVAKTGGPIIIERDGKPVAVLLSITQYEQMQRRPALPAEQSKLLREAFGLWSNREDINDTWLADGRSRWQSQWQDE
jgi:prevent-host-death family protein